MAKTDSLENVGESVTTDDYGRVKLIQAKAEEMAEYAAMLLTLLENPIEKSELTTADWAFFKVKMEIVARLLSGKGENISLAAYVAELEQKARETDALVSEILEGRERP